MFSTATYRVNRVLLALTLLLITVSGTATALQVSLLYAPILNLTLSAPTYALENQEVVDNTSGGIIYPVWSHDNLKIAYLANPASGVIEIRVFDLKTNTVHTVAGNAACVRLGRLAWSPDDSSILYLSKRDDLLGLDEHLILAKCSATVLDQFTFDLVKPSDLGVTVSWSSGPGEPCVTQTDSGWKLIVAITDRPGGPYTEGIYVMDIAPSGTPNPVTAHKVLGIPAGLFINPSLSSNGDRLLLEHPWTNTDRNIWLVDGILDVLNGKEPPINSFYDPRMHQVDTNAHYVMYAEFSQDDSLIYFCEDVSGNFTETTMNFDTSNFDLVAARTSDVISGQPQPTYVPVSGTQAFASASRGGPRISYVDWNRVDGGRLFIATLTVSDTPATVGNIVQSDFYLRDGSGTSLKVPAGTVLSGFTGQPTISISTPYTPVSAPEVPVGVQGIPVVRVFGPSGMDFAPAAILQLHYTDAEIAGQDEANLQVFEFNTVTGQYDLPIPVLTRDPGANMLSAAIDGFSRYGMGAEIATDSDLDDLSDTQEAALGTNPHEADTDHDGLTDHQEIWRDGDPLFNPYNPSTNPSGTDTNPLLPDTDGDGVSDGLEVQLNTNPLDPIDVPALSTATTLGLTLLGTIFAYIATARILRQKRKPSFLL